MADACGSGGSEITRSQSRILNDLPVPALQSSFREAWLGGLSGRLFGDTWLSGGDSGQPSFHSELPLLSINSGVCALQPQEAQSAQFPRSSTLPGTSRALNHRRCLKVMTCPVKSLLKMRKSFMHGKTTGQSRL